MPWFPPTRRRSTYSLRDLRLGHTRGHRFDSCRDHPQNAATPGQRIRRPGAFSCWVTAASTAAIGLALGLIATRLLEALLIGVRAGDPLTLNHAVATEWKSFSVTIGRNISTDCACHGVGANDVRNQNVSACAFSHGISTSTNIEIPCTIGTVSVPVAGFSESKSQLPKRML